MALLVLVCLPIWITVQSPALKDSELYHPVSRIDSFVSETRLVHWPLAKQGAFDFNHPVPDTNDHGDMDFDYDWSPQTAGPNIPPAAPHLLWIDFTAELSALALLAFT
ncbi:hypothetical protein IW136_005703 [Coemansia sp. RSA 678]|nr:hypothetical protein IW136_005703 [Coemansia sp. RSA 678]